VFFHRQWPFICRFFRTVRTPTPDATPGRIWARACPLASLVATRLPRCDIVAFLSVLFLQGIEPLLRPGPLRSILFYGFCDLWKVDAGLSLTLV
jgi:hypothetical protein